MEEVQVAVLEQEEEKKSIDTDHDVNDIEENMEDASVLIDIEVENIQIPSKKPKQIQWLN